MEPWAAYPKGSLEISVSYDVLIRPRHEDLSTWMSSDTEVLQSDLFLLFERNLKSSSKSPVEAHGQGSQGSFGVCSHSIPLSVEMGRAAMDLVGVSLSRKECLGNAHWGPCGKYVLCFHLIQLCFKGEQWSASEVNLGTGLPDDSLHNQWAS